MHITISKVTSEAEFPAIIDSEWESHISPPNPHNGVWEFLCPVFGTHPTAREEAIQASLARQYGRHERDPTSHWVKAVDEDAGGKVVGAAVWNVFEKNPYEGLGEGKGNEDEGGLMTAGWWPEGPKREMADQVLMQLVGGRVEMMGKAHVCELCAFLRFASPFLLGCGLPFQGFHLEKERLDLTQSSCFFPVESIRSLLGPSLLSTPRYRETALTMGFTAGG